MLTPEDTAIALHVARGIAGGPRQAGRVLDDMTFAARIDARVMRDATESRAWRSSAAPAHVARAFVGLPLSEFLAALE